MDRKIPLPRGWNRRTKAAIVQMLALSHYAFTAVLARGANAWNPRARLQAEIERLDHEVALLRQEMAIKDARMTRLVPHRRPFYTPLERMAILELRAARASSLVQTAKRVLGTTPTVASWMHRLDEEGPDALVQVPQPVNKFPEFVGYLVQRLKVLCPGNQDMQSYW